ncbi:ferredoxin [Streptomyces sp. JJ38]|uniref:ferredoxin n=1 Tax=Streptomyces sp. JJ38 TaxID=2738128 RepID=UPI001C5701F7|nr:ferredoxin [Streptomyces sp. JJ38]MBW1598065.1 ferredoxin [Streptomyces sp. JJ38]
MRITVDMDLCDNHGQCVFAAPEVFAFDDEERLVYEAAPAAELYDDVEHAAAACPLRAITLIDDQP